MTAEERNPAAEPTPAHESNEWLRKALHIGFGLGAFTLYWLPWPVAALVALAAVFGNWLLLHRLVGRSVSRHQRGFDAGIVLYPTVVLMLILVFRHQLWIAAATWAILAFGDGIATLVGKSLPIAPLPWNRRKSLGGMLAFVVAGSASAIAVALLFDASIAVVALGAVAAAIAETLDLGVDDNIVSPAAAAVTMTVLSLSMLPWTRQPDIPSIWIGINTLLAVAGYVLKSVDLSGAIGGWILGDILLVGSGWQLYAALLAFFIIGTACTKLGYSRKARLGLAQEKGGRRGFGHAFANVGVAAICAIACWREPMFPLPFLMGVAALATAAADTTASELGQLFGRRAFLPLTLRPVPVGTEGAISVEGTLAGLVAAFVVALVGTQHLDRSTVLVTACAFIGSYVESVVGSWNRRQSTPIANGALNFFNTAIGALLAYALAKALGIGRPPILF